MTSDGGSRYHTKTPYTIQSLYGSDWKKKHKAPSAKTPAPSEQGAFERTFGSFVRGKTFTSTQLKNLLGEKVIAVGVFAVATAGALYAGVPPGDLAKFGLQAIPKIANIQNDEQLYELMGNILGGPLDMGSVKRDSATVLTLGKMADSFNKAVEKAGKNASTNDIIEQVEYVDSKALADAFSKAFKKKNDENAYEVSNLILKGLTNSVKTALQNLTVKQLAEQFSNATKA